MKPIDLLAAAYRRCGPLGPLLVWLAACFITLSLFRCLHTALYAERVAKAAGWGWVFPIGMRMDSVLLAFLAMLPAVCLLLVPGFWKRRPAAPALYAAVVSAILVYLEFATIPFMKEFDARPNRIFIEYLNNPKEVFTTIAKTVPLQALVGLLLLVGVAWGAWRGAKALIARMGDWHLCIRLTLLPVVAGLLVLAARGGIGHRPVNISTAAFSDEHLLNELALNSVYSVSYAAYATGYEDDPGKSYGQLANEVVYAEVAAAAGRPAYDATAKFPTLVPFTAREKPARPRNLVIILEESLGAEYVGALGGLPLTPRIDALAGEGLFFDNLYSTGTRTVRGIEAVVSGFLPTPGRSVVKLGRSQKDFFTIADLLGRHGYKTHFVYGGESHFDNMRSFFLGNGVQQLHDEPTFADAKFHGTWGVCDEDLFTAADKLFAAQGDQPFFALVLTTTNHTPFEFPDGAIELYEQPKQTVHNAMKYADYAVGRFFDTARTRAYYQDTLFLVVADHNTRTWGDDLIPVNKFHIPGLLIGPGVPKQRFAPIASQIDLLPTILPLLGIDGVSPLVGRDLLSLPAGDPGRAILQFERTNAYMEGERVVVLQPKSAPRSFTYRDGRLQDATDDPALIRRAHAHALLPGILYREGRYGLPPGR